MTLSRRDLLKISVFAGAAVALPLERSVNACLLYTSPSPRD